MGANSNIKEQVQSLGGPDLKRLVLIAAHKLRCFGIPPSEAEAEDIVQTAIAKALEGRRSWDRKTPLFYFLAGAVCSEISNLATSARRKATRNSEPFNDNACALMEVDGAESNGEVDLVLRELQQQDAVAYRIANSFRECEHLSTSDLALRLEMTINEVTNAKRRLKRFFQKANLDLHSSFKRNGRKEGK
jgi:DNA-directed RNA polymerase specialized sigma24 family protein